MKKTRQKIIQLSEIGTVSEKNIEIQNSLANNIDKPETFGVDKRVSGRTKQLNLPVKPIFHQQLKTASAQEGRPMSAILEDALNLYLAKQKK